MANLQKRAAAASFKRSSLCKHYKPACDKGGCEKDAQVLCLQGPTVLGATDGTGCCGGQNQTKGPFAHHVRPRRPAEQPHGELLRKKNKKAISKFLTKVLAGKITSDTQPAMAAQGSFAEWDEGVEETENVEEDVEGANVEEVEKPKKRFAGAEGSQDKEGEEAIRVSLYVAGWAALRLHSPAASNYRALPQPLEIKLAHPTNPRFFILPCDPSRLQWARSASCSRAMGLFGVEACDANGAGLLAAGGAACDLLICHDNAMVLKTLRFWQREFQWSRWPWPRWTGSQEPHARLHVQQASERLLACELMAGKAPKLGQCNAPLWVGAQASSLGTRLGFHHTPAQGHVGRLGEYLWVGGRFAQRDLLARGCARHCKMFKTLNTVGGLRNSLS